jgi:hypothetical protein
LIGDLRAFFSPATCGVKRRGGVAIGIRSDFKRLGVGFASESVGIIAFDGVVFEIVVEVGSVDEGSGVGGGPSSQFRIVVTFAEVDPACPWASVSFMRSPSAS